MTSRRVSPQPFGVSLGDGTDDIGAAGVRGLPHVDAGPSFRRDDSGARLMIGVGLVLLILGMVFNIYVLWAMGIVLLVVGAVFWLLGALGRPVAGRRYWY